MFKVVGKTITPIVTKERRFGHDYGLVIIKGVERFYGKIKKDVRMFPSSFKAFFGIVEYYTNEPEKVLLLDSLGRFQSEGMGRVRWLKVEENVAPPKPRKKIKIMRCLPKLSPAQERMVLAMLLHDFVSTPKHQSKIYFDVEIKDDRVRWLCVHHHDEIEDEELKTLQKFDRLSAMITRRVRFKSFSRYSLKAKSKIDFEKLKKEIEFRQYSPYSLYSYVYNSKELEVITESLEYGFTSLRRHLLLMVNLYLSSSP